MYTCLHATFSASNLLKYNGTATLGGNRSEAASESSLASFCPRMYHFVPNGTMTAPENADTNSLNGGFHAEDTYSHLRRRSGDPPLPEQTAAGRRLRRHHLQCRRQTPP